MKSFKVPVKNTDEDFITTNNFWLTLNCQKGDCTILKRDNKNELLFGISDGKEAAELSGLAAGNTLSAVFEQISGKGPKAALLYIDSYEHKLSYAGQTEFQTYLFRCKKKDAVLLKPGEDYKTEEGDTIAGFSGKIGKNDLEKLEETVKNNPHIAYLLMQDITAALANTNSGSQPLFLIDHTEHQSYAFPIKSSLKTVSLTIDMIKNKLVKHDLEKIWQVETVLHEALVNAITYGNDLDNSKNVEISYEMGKKGLRMVVKDKGTGFDVNNITVPVGTEALEKVNGRGIYIMQKFTDALYFNEIGNELILFFNF